MEEENSKEIKLEDVKFPEDFKFQQTSNGFKLNTETGGEFFPNKTNKLGCHIFAYVLLTSFFFCFFGPVYFSITTYYDKSIKEILSLGSFLSGFVIIPCIFIFFMFIWKITNIKTEYIYSSNGINVTSKKGSLFIPKENIKKIYVKKLTNIINGLHYEDYHIYIDLKKALYIPYAKTYKGVINLFFDHQFKEENTALFLFQQLNKIFDLNNEDNYFEEINENEIQLPKDLNYQQINNSIKITSGGGSLFKENLFFKFLHIFFLFLIVCTIYILIFVNLLQLAKLSLSFLNILGSFHVFAFFIIFPIIFFAPIILASIVSKIISKITMPKADYIFSPDGINVICKKELISIPKDSIDYIDIEHDENKGDGVITSYIAESQLYYKIIVNLKEPISTKFNSIYEFDKLAQKNKDSNIQKTFDVFNFIANAKRKDLKSKLEKAQLLDKFKDKKVARFFVQEMKKALQMD